MEKSPALVAKIMQYLSFADANKVSGDQAFTIMLRGLNLSDDSAFYKPVKLHKLLSEKGLGDERVVESLIVFCGNILSDEYFRVPQNVIADFLADCSIFECL